MTVSIVRVNGDIRDIFFNMDHRPVFDKDGHGDYMDLNDNADLLISCLDRLGVCTPIKEDLIADFYARL